MPADDGVAFPAHVFGQIAFHQRGCGEGHGVKVRIEFRQETDAITLRIVRSFDARLVIREPFLRRETGHPDVDARFLRIAIWIGVAHLAKSGNGRIEQHHIDMMMIVG